MTDRELLEAAAGAAGHDSSRWVVQPHGDREGLQFTGAMGVWNPLTDDGDALRLAVGLNICTLFPMVNETRKQCGAGLVGGTELACMEPYAPDPCAAMRRAIVRAAAEIGRKP